MSKVENLQTINRAKPFPCVSVALAVLAMFVLSWLAAKGVRNNLQTLLIFAGLCSPIFIAELRNHHNKWAIIVFNAVPVITYAFGYLVLRGPVLTGSMVLWLADFGVSICIWVGALGWSCTRVRPTMSAAQAAEAAWIRSSANAATLRLPGRNSADVKHVERRAAFWAKATAKLDALSKRVSPEERRKLEAALEVRIPKPSSEEIRSYHRAQQRRQARRRGSRGATGPNSSASNRAGESVARARAAPPAPRAATLPRCREA